MKTLAQILVLSRLSPWGQWAALIHNRHLDALLSPVLPSLRGSTTGKGRSTDCPPPYVAGVSGSGGCVRTSTPERCSGPDPPSVLSSLRSRTPEKQPNVVYEVPCICGKLYIGKIRRRLETCLKEHIDACIKGFTDISAVEDHTIRWDDTLTLQFASRTMVKEAICIQTILESSHFNRDGGYDIPDCCIATCRKLRRTWNPRGPHPSIRIVRMPDIGQLATTLAG